MEKILSGAVKKNRFFSSNTVRCLRTLTGLDELRQGLQRIAPDGEKYTKPKGKERPTEAPLPFRFCYFSLSGL